MSEGHRLDKKVDHSYEELKALLLASDRDFDMEKIDKAYQFALESHGDQKRPVWRSIYSASGFCRLHFGRIGDGHRIHCGLPSARRGGGYACWLRRDQKAVRH